MKRLEQIEADWQELSEALEEVKKAMHVHRVQWGRTVRRYGEIRRRIEATRRQIDRLKAQQSRGR